MKIDRPPACVPCRIVGIAQMGRGDEGAILQALRPSTTMAHVGRRCLRGVHPHPREDAMNASGRLTLCVLSLLLVLSTNAAAQTGAKSKTVRLTNQQNAPAEVYINFAPDSVLKPSDLPFCKVTGPLNCQFSLAAHASQDVPNPGNKYLNIAVAFNAPVSCGSTKAEVVANNPNWYDVLDVSVVDGFN